MSFFSALKRFLFGGGSQKEQSGDADADVIANLYRKRDAAAGTVYDATLVKGLVADHKRLLDGFGRIVAAKDGGDFVLAAAQLRQFKSDLTGHLMVENVRFYVFLDRVLAGDQSFTAKRFRDEMDAILKVVREFFKKYDFDEIPPNLRSEFSKELEGVGAALVERIKREELELYPLYDGAAGAAT